MIDAESADQAGLADIVIVFTKTGATRAALADAMPVIGPDTRLFSIQNGLGNDGVLAEFVPRDSATLRVNLGLNRDTFS